MAPIVEGGDIVEPLRERVLGRVLAEPVLIPGTDKVAYDAGTMLDEATVQHLDEMSIDHLMVRSPIPVRFAMAFAHSVTDVTWHAVVESISAKPSALSPRSRSASLAHS